MTDTISSLDFINLDAPSNGFVLEHTSTASRSYRVAGRNSRIRGLADEQLRDNREEGAVDALALPGEVVTAQAMRHFYQRDALVALVHQLAIEDAESESRISTDTAQTATAFIRALNFRCKLPRIAPDGEGGLMMIWDAAGSPTLLVTVDEWRLHAVRNATTAQARYFDRLIFDGERIPREIGESIPSV